MKNDFDQETPKARVFNESFEFKKRREFSNREVGVTHPDNTGFMRIADSGEIEIFAAPGIGLIINPNTRSVSIYADSIKFYSKEDDGLRWNEKSFNPASDVYNEPALIKTNDFLNNPAYYRASHYLDNLNIFDQNQGQDALTIMGKYGLGLERKGQAEQILNSPKLTLEQKKLIEDYAQKNPQEKVILLTDLMFSGYSFQEAIEKMDNNDMNISESTDRFPRINGEVENK